MENSTKTAVLAICLTACGGSKAVVAPPPLPAITAFSATPAALQAGQSSTLSWSVTGATSRSIDGGVGDVTGASSKTVSPSATTVYTLTATNAAGSTSRTASVTVSAPGPQPPVISSFAASPAALQPGQSSTLSWTVTGATSLALDGGVGNVTGASSKTVSPSATTVYTLTATNADGSTSKTASVTVSAPTNATVAVDTSQDHQTISPYVYGYNAASTAGAPPGATWLRLGGNRWTAYNWTNNYSNAGSDYGPYHNDTLMGSPSDGPGHAAVPAIDDAKAHGVSLLVTIPIQGWVSKDASGNVDPTSPLTDHFAHNQTAKNSAFTTSPSPTSDPVFQDEFAAFVAGRWGAGAGAIHFSLDNEPDLWSSTHAEVQRTQLSYAALLGQSIAAAGAIKTAVPTALIYGPVSYGWAGYLNLQNAPDASQLGDFLDYYLDQMSAAASAQSRRLLDVLDLHFYSEAQGCGARVNDSNAGNGDCVVAARVQSTRSLWDPGYKEYSWITGCCSNGTGIQLVPRMLGKIAAHYPGTRLAITEYNHGGSDHISGAVAQADTLGAFGRGGVYAASYWPLLADNSWAFAAWRAFRGYDGAGRNFGDTSVRAASSDVAHVAAYASVDSAAPNRVVLVLVHRPGAVTDASGAVTGSDGTQSRTVAIQVSHPTPLGTARAWQLAPGVSPSWQALSLPAPQGNALTLTLPALSVTTVELTP